MKLFNRWDTGNVKVESLSLQPYINLREVLVPRTGGIQSSGRIWGPKVHIVERLMNKLMIPGHRGRKHKLSSGRCTGKGITVYKIVYKALEIVEDKSKDNPIKILIKAIENAAPREGITTIEYGGASYLKSVEVAPQRAIDLVLRWMTQGAYASTFKSKRKIEECLAEEILNAYSMNPKSNAIAKKQELERQASASR